MEKKTFVKGLVLICIIGLTICILSYRMNWNLTSTVITNLVVIILYWFSYYLIDSRAVQKEKNKHNVAKLLLTSCAKECKKNIDLLDDQEVLKLYIVPKVDFSTSPKNDPIVSGIEQAPFTNESVIISFFEDGLLSDGILRSYLELKRRHREYIQMKIILFDAKPPHSFQLETMKKELENSIDRLIKICKKEDNAL